MTEYIFGFKFDKEEVEKIRNNDLALSILVSLQQNGVAIVSTDGYEYSGLNKFEPDMWTSFNDEVEGMTSIVVNEIKPVYEG